jgi:hypothetical protein
VVSPKYQIRPAFLHGADCIDAAVKSLTAASYNPQDYERRFIDIAPIAARVSAADGRSAVGLVGAAQVAKCMGFQHSMERPGHRHRTVR